MQVVKTWITGSPKGEYICSVTMEIQSGPYRLQLSGMRIIQAHNRRILAMPSRKLGDRWSDLVHPLDQKTRNMLETAALEYYDNHYGPNGLNR